jgi:ketosteroid isomerase-like protein
VRSVRVPILLTAFLIFFLPASAPAATPPSASAVRGDEKLLRDLEARFVRAVADKKRDGFLAFWAKDAAIFPPGAGPAVGHDKIWESWSPILENPDATLTWQPTRAEMAASGDLGYTYGRYESKRKGADGGVITRTGCYVTIWRKEKDGAWRVVLDIGSPDPPPPAPSDGSKTPSP